MCIRDRILIGGLILLARRSNGMPGGPGQAMQFGKSKARFAMDAILEWYLTMLQELMRQRRI